MSRPRGPASRAGGSGGPAARATARPAAEPAGPLEVDLEALSAFFGTPPAWSDRATGRVRYRIDAPAGGWLECYVSPAERVVSVRVADGAVQAIHVDLTLEGVEALGVRRSGSREPWLEVTAGPPAGGCRVAVTLRPDILVVLDHGRR